MFLTLIEHHEREFGGTHKSSHVPAPFFWRGFEFFYFLNHVDTHSQIIYKIQNKKKKDESRKLEVIPEADDNKRYLTRSPMIDIVRGVEEGGDMFFPLDLGTDASPTMKTKAKHQFGSMTAPVPPSNETVVSDCSPMSSPSTDSSGRGADPSALQLSTSCDASISLRIPISNCSVNMNSRRSQSLESKKDLEIIFRSLERKKRSALSKSRKSPRISTGLPMPYKRTTPLGSYTGEPSSLASLGQKSSGGSIKFGSLGEDRDWFSD